MMTTRRQYGLLLPVKPLAIAKSRLAPLGESPRRELVVAMALDTLRATLASPLVAEVLVVTDDHRLADHLRIPGVDVVPDGDSDLNRSLVAASHELERRAPGTPVAAVCADLPAMKTHEITEALEHALATGGFVPDRAGGGTTLVAAAGVSAFRPRLGPGSRAAHDALGLPVLDDSPRSGLRHDVDTPADLHAALSLHVGRETARVSARLSL
jgi:2-phospho-L-lactate guanylyltransferase